MSVDYLPVWKRNATAEERFQELAQIAAKHPERFGKICVVYEETLKNGCTVIRQVSNGANTNELIGILELAKLKVVEETLG